MFFLALDLSFFIPLAAGCLLSAIGGNLSKRVLGIYVTGICALTLILVGLTFIGGDFNVTLWRLTDTLGITVGSDGIARLFASVIVSVWIIVSVYATFYMRHEENEVRFFSFYLIVLGMLILLSFSANLFTMYLFFELMTLTTLPLVLHTMTREAVNAGFKSINTDTGPFSRASTTARLMSNIIGPPRPKCVKSISPKRLSTTGGRGNFFSPRP